MPQMPRFMKMGVRANDFDDLLSSFASEDAQTKMKAEADRIRAEQEAKQLTEQQLLAAQQAKDAEAKAQAEQVARELKLTQERMEAERIERKRKEAERRRLEEEHRAALEAQRKQEMAEAEAKRQQELKEEQERQSKYLANAQNEASRLERLAKLQTTLSRCGKIKSALQNAIDNNIAIPDEKREGIMDAYEESCLFKSAINNEGVETGFMQVASDNPLEDVAFCPQLKLRLGQAMTKAKECGIRDDACLMNSMQIPRDTKFDFDVPSPHRTGFTTLLNMCGTQDALDLYPQVPAVTRFVPITVEKEACKCRENCTSAVAKRHTSRSI